MRWGRTDTRGQDSPRRSIPLRFRSRVILQAEALRILPSRPRRTPLPVIVLVADGARLDAFQGDLKELPALRRLRDEGGLHPITTVFPSVTAPAYTPFPIGRFPASIGVPGIRWYDRARTACGWPDHARSYVGFQFRRFNDDL